MKDSYRIVHCEATGEYMAQREVWSSYEYGIPCDPVWGDVGEWRDNLEEAEKDVYADHAERTKWILRERYRVVQTIEMTGG